MTLQLNLKAESYKIDKYNIYKFRKFFGSIKKQTPRLKKSGRYPASVYSIMQRRVELRRAPFDEKSKYPKSTLCEFIEQNWEKFYKSRDKAIADWNHVKTAWMDNYFDTGDGIVYHPDGKFKLVLDSQHLRNLTENIQLINGALPLEEGVYETLPGLEFSKKDREKKGTPWSFWQALARKDKTLLEAYVDTIRAEYQRRFAPNEDLKKSKIMRILVDNRVFSKSPEMRALCVYRLGSRSDVNGWYDLDNYDGLLVGLAPEAQGARKLPYTN
jgi:hypothetical protein